MNEQRYDLLLNEDFELMFFKKRHGHTFLTEKLCVLMRSDFYADWIEVWNLVRNRTPQSIRTFDAFDSFFGIADELCFINNMLYELEIELYNEGLDDLNILAKRAKIANWVYTQFTEESTLNIGNFRTYEAESLWETDRKDKAEHLFQELIGIFPRFTYGYIFYGDCYWRSDWSYLQGPNYDRAEIIYREALRQRKIEDIDVVKDRLEDMLFEKKHPEKRQEIKKIRLKRIQSRKKLE